MYSLGIDIGSSSIKIAVYDPSHRLTPVVVKFPETEMKIDSPQTGWAEQSPQLWWEYVIEGIQKVITQSGIRANEIKSIGIAYQMHGLVLVDKSGKPLRPSIIWCDSRAIEAGEQIQDDLEPQIVSNHILNEPGNFTAAKLRWVRDHEPEVFKKIYKVMLPGDFIAFKMSNSYTSTHTGMSEGIFWDFSDHKLSDHVLHAVGISPDCFPSLGGSFDVLANTNTAFYELTGIEVGTPISYRAGDQPNNAFSLGVLNKGEAAGTGGTSGVVYAVSDQVSFDPHSRVNTFAHVNHDQVNKSFGTLLCINGTGILYQWVRTNFFPGWTYDECEVAATDVPSDGLLCLPFGNGSERMLRNDNSGAAYYGLDLNRHTNIHLLRAALEGIAFSFVYGIEILKSLDISIEKMRVGADNLFRSRIFSKIIADLTGIQIDMYDTTGAVGAAKGSAFGAGLVSEMEYLFTDLHSSLTYYPQVADETMQQNFLKWKQLLNKNLKNQLI